VTARGPTARASTGSPMLSSRLTCRSPRTARTDRSPRPH
jgi:hypothetical protein